MKIPLRVGKITEKQKAPYPILTIRIRKEHVRPPIFGQIYALIDTGSTATHISYKDMKTLGIQIKRLPKGIGRPIIIGGV